MPRRPRPTRQSGKKPWCSSLRTPTWFHPPEFADNPEGTRYPTARAYERNRHARSSWLGLTRSKHLYTPVRRLGWFGAAILGMFACQNAERPSAAPATAAPAGATPASAAPANVPAMVLHEPKEGATVSTGPKSWAFGWCVDKTGIARVNVVADTGATSPVVLRQPFPGVVEAYPSYPGADQAGFGFPLPNLAPGIHTITVTCTATNGGQTEVRRQVRIK